MLAIMLLTSKGAAGVTGGGFLALTATLGAMGTIPAAGIMLVFGIDTFMSECRALVDFCGNAVATLFIGKWDRTLDIDRARAVLRGEDVPWGSARSDNEADADVTDDVSVPDPAVARPVDEPVPAYAERTA